MKTLLPSPRNHGLDTLRALAIIFVVLHHYVLFVSHESTFGWVGDIGWVGVDLFFALSGYLIGNQIFSALRSREQFSLPRFYARRLLRTLPNFYVVLALYYLWPWFRGDATLLPLWRFLTFTQNINLEPGTAFSHAWSLCIEEQFYLLLPALALGLAAMRRSLRWGWTLIALAFIAGMVIRYALWTELVEASTRPQFNYFKYIYYSTFCRFDELVAGVALALLRNFHPRQWRSLTSNGNALLAGGVAVCAIAFWLFLDDRRALPVTVVGFPMLALGFSLLILAALSRRSLLRSVKVPGAASVALWSYAIYLGHKQLCILLAEPLSGLGYPPDSATAACIAMAASVFAGWLLYTCVERPFMQLRQRYVPGNFKPR
ncbi:acyltransferase [Massilia sp. PAMC28688]|uniref:acyltransferase family protein n=1 Tax=Massilia sp. PAMC28688 TaxID=2861283 RepID=UPI001C62EDE3|nr:acyltransferase [Massilia sp. PAMC28688]QYF93382.1 acyltransferase [Massilia sp. PAMC28688]